jgi:chaperonin GroEL
VALLRAVEGLEVETETEDQAYGVEIIKLAVKEPLRQMATNAGASPDLIVKLVEEQEKECGYNFVTEEVVNLYDAGIIDPTKVVRCALQNAASAASTLITTNYCVVAS